MEVRAGDGSRRRYAATLAAVGNFIGVTAGDLLGLSCLLDAIDYAVREGMVAHDDHIIMYVDSDAVWTYVVEGIRPPGDYLTPLVGLVNMRVRARLCERAGLRMWRVASSPDAEPGDLAHSSLQCALNWARRNGSAGANAVFMVGVGTSVVLEKALYRATRTDLL